MKKIRLIIIEDNRLLREGVIALLKEHHDLNVVAAFGGAENVLSKIRDLKPDVMLLDLGLPDQNALELVKSLKAKFPKTRVIVMDLVPIQADILQFVKAGVSGFILKDATTVDFIRTIRLVAGGDKILPPHLTGSLFSQIIDYGVKEMGASKLVESVRMTKREREVVELIAAGLSNKEIANKLQLSIYTIKSHVHNILEKMALNTRVQIAIYAHSNDDFSTTSSDTPDTSSSLG
jgi:DNA-binding NarL/FixJ family response regulator